MFTHRVNFELELQLLAHEDAEELFTRVDQDRSHLRQWLPWVDDTKAIQDSASFIQLSLNQFVSGNGFQAGIRYKKQLVGMIGLHGIDRGNRKTSIGYWLGSDFQGKGIMTEACKSVIDLAFSDYKLNRVEIRAAIDNERSRKVAERLGFIYEGCIRQAEWLYDRYVDHAIYGMLKQSWSLQSDAQRFFRHFELDRTL